MLDAAAITITKLSAGLGGHGGEGGGEGRAGARAAGGRHGCRGPGRQGRQGQGGRVADSWWRCNLRHLARHWVLRQSGLFWTHVTHLLLTDPDTLCPHSAAGSTPQLLLVQGPQHW